MWFPAYGIGLTEVTSEATSIDVSKAEDNPPKAVLQNDTIANSTSEYIQLFTGLSEAKLPVYITMYLSEVASLLSTQKRSFQLYVDDNPFNLDTIVPPFGSVLETSITNISASSQTSFHLRPTSDSTLPILRLLRAVEDEAAYVTPRVRSRSPV